MIVTASSSISYILQKRAKVFLVQEGIQLSWKLIFAILTFSVCHATALSIYFLETSQSIFFERRKITQRTNPTTSAYLFPKAFFHFFLKIIQKVADFNGALYSGAFPLRIFTLKTATFSCVYSN